VIWIVGGAVLVIAGVGIAFDVLGLGGALWRFWAFSYRRRGLQPRRNALFVRVWFGALLAIIGAGWIYSGVV
jgi:hypothetical protein